MCQNMTVPLVGELYAKMSPRQVGNEEIKVCECEGEVGEKATETQLIKLQLG